MSKIIEIDNTQSPPSQRVVFQQVGISKARLCKEAITIASAYTATVPNSPIIDVTGERELSCLIGVVKIRTWKMEYADSD